MKFTTDMAVPKPQGTSIKCDSFIRTRRINKTQSFLLEERLKALDCKKNQKNAEFDEEKHSLRKRIEEIKTVRKNWGISVERRKLLRSRGFTIDARAASNSCDDVVAIKKYSMPELTGQRTSNRYNSDSIIRGLSQLNVQQTEEMEKEADDEEPAKTGGARSRARHQFRVIEPPCRPGSRRNFVQLSNDKLKELKEKEDEESREETLFDSNVKLDHRGMILSPKPMKSLRNSSQSEMDQGVLIMQSSESCEGSIPGKQIYKDKQTIDAASYSVRPSNAELISPCKEKQACVEIEDLEDNIRPEEQLSQKKLISISRESLDHMTEVHAPDSFPDYYNNNDRSISGDLIRLGSPHTDRKSTAVHDTRVTRTAHSALGPRRKHTTYSNRSPARLAFVEPQNGTSNTDNHSQNNQGINVTESRQLRAQHERGTPIEARDCQTDKVSSHEKSPQLHKKAGLTRRATLPSGFFNGAQSSDSVKSHQESNRETKRLSVASHSPNVQSSKITAFSSQHERGHSENAVTYAYDARPGRSLCKGYVTMQMTVKGKQVKVHIPKFPHDSDSQPVLERARKKAADELLQPRLLHEKEKIVQEQNPDDLS